MDQLIAESQSSFRDSVILSGNASASNAAEDVAVLQLQSTLPDFTLVSLQKRFQSKDLEELYKRYEQRAQIGQ